MRLKTGKQIIKLLEKMSIIQALWWYIEEMTDEHPARSEVFFYLRARYRTEVQA